MRFLVLIFIIAFSSQAFAQQAVPPELSVAEKVQSYLNKLTTVQADFLQISPEGNESTGKFYLSRPGKMRWQYNPPVPVLIVLSGGILSYYDAELDQVSHLPSATNLSSLLARDKIALSGDITILDAKEQDGLITITLTQTKKPEEGKLTLIFTAEPMQLKKMVVTNQDNKQTEVTFSNMAFDLSFDKGLFVMPNPRLNQKGRSRN